MLKKIKITSKSVLKKNQKFSLKLFKKPFCANEKNRFKHKEIIKFKNKKFWKKSDEFNNLGKILVVSGPGRQGNHILLSLLDNNKHMFPNIGEDKFLENFFNSAKKNEKKIIKESLSKNGYKKFLNMSGFNNHNKWKKLWSAEKKKFIPKNYSGTEKNKNWYADFKGYTPKIKYLKFYKKIKELHKNIKKDSTFLDIYKNYLISLNYLLNKNNSKYKIQYRYTGSSMRRELFYLFENTSNVICISPIRRFESFYFSFSKSYFNSTEIKKKYLNEAWEHWRHKIIDYLLLKKKYPKKIILVKFEDLINNPELVFKKINNFLKIKTNVKNIKMRILGKRVYGNSSSKISKKTNKYGVYKPEGSEYFFDKNILPPEYFDIIKKVNKFSI